MAFLSWVVMAFQLSVLVQAKSQKRMRQMKNLERSLVTCAAMYAAIPLSYLDELKNN